MEGERKRGKERERWQEGGMGEEREGRVEGGKEGRENVFRLFKFWVV